MFTPQTFPAQAYDKLTRSVVTVVGEHPIPGDDGPMPGFELGNAPEGHSQFRNDFELNFDVEAATAFWTIFDAVSAASAVIREHAGKLLLEDISEAMNEFHVPPAILGQIIMEHLPLGPGISAEEKHYWLSVSTHMGPDHIDSLRKVGTFMSKVEAF